MGKMINGKWRSGLTRGERFKDARTVHNKRGGQTMDEVSAATGISKSLIWDLERDIDRSVGYDKVVKLALHYGVSTDYLLGLTNDPSPKVSVPMDQLGLPGEVCDMLLDYNIKGSLQRKGFEALCKTEEFFKMLEKVGVLCEKGPFDSEDIPIKNLRNHYRGKPEEAERPRLVAMNGWIKENYPDLQKHGEFCYGRDFADLLRFQIVQLMESALKEIQGGK